ncbi:MAG: hypothetical protein HAW63_02390 [Bdellovibrionaceae bacterium]|nr:hypothetical protein [Pseudobdellovibrionaceae bacterium]
MSWIKKKGKLFFWVLAISITLSSMFYFFRLKTVEISILPPAKPFKEKVEFIYTKQEYKNKIKKLLKPYIGQSLLFLNFKNVFSLLKKEKIFLNLTFYKKFPNTLKVNFTLNPKFFLHLSKGGKLYKILSNGKLLSTNTKKVYSEPILTGSLPSNKRQKQQFLDFIFQLFRFPSFANKIATVRYSSNKEAHLFLEQPYLKIQLNWKSLALEKNNNLKSTIKKINQVLKYLEQHSYKARTIDARFVNKIFVSYH